MKRLWIVSIIVVLISLFATACGKELDASYPESYGNGTDVLYTYGFELYSDRYARGLEDGKPEVVDSFRAAGAEEEFLRELMSGSSKIDLYIVASSDQNSYKYWENHAFTDLSVSETLVNCVAQMHGVLKDSAYQGNELAGIPVRVMGAVMAYNQASEGYPLVKENIADWDDLLSFAEDDSSQYTVLANKAGLYHRLFAQYVYGYGDPLENDVDFDTETFRKVLVLMKQIHDSPHFQEPGSGAMAFQNDHSFRATDVIGINWTDLAGIADPQRLPDIEADHALSPQIGVIYAVVNPNSEHKEDAIHYLEMLVTGNAFTEVGELFPLSGNDSLNLYMEEAMVCYELGLYGMVSDDINGWLEGRVGMEETVEAIQEKVTCQFPHSLL
ncbi:MAG: hypothetical protein NC417_09175 [Candidatus Gastranaerophilales bacterium]|nr:hypothetical protein [Candidatus Gastranaerophilales bacterium]